MRTITIGDARHADAEIGVAEHRHPAALEVGQEHRLVDVALRIEIAEADDVGDAMRVVGKLRHGLARLRAFGGLVVHGILPICRSS